MLVFALLSPASLSAQGPGTAGPAAAGGVSAESPGSLEALDKREFDLERLLESARLDLLSAERRFARAQERLDQVAEASDELHEEAAARRLQLSSTQRVISLVEGRVRRADLERAVRIRLGELGSRRARPETLSDWGAETETSLEALGRDLALKRSRVDELAREISFTRERQQQLSPSSPTRRWVELQAHAREELLRHYEADIGELETLLRLEQELRVEIERKSEELAPLDRARVLVDDLRAAWNYRLAGSPEAPITFGKIASAVLIFLIGYVLARVVSRVMGSRVFSRIRLEQGATHALESLTFYFLLLVAFLTALRVVQIPLTAFAVVGGALAIGVGFGSQNVVSNFMSGLILLIERPIKLGDLIEVEGIYGSVEQIGLRSTRVRTGDNTHIIVPNASFLENNVINWTHTDPRVRVTISVGVVYGSPTREVERLIHAALDDHRLVLKQPEPVVLFRDFGNDALIFETRFWIEMRSILDRLKVESDVRFRIDELFRQAGIVIAFPQRDVHLDATAPIEVKLLDGGGRESAREA